MLQFDDSCYVDANQYHLAPFSNRNSTLNTSLRKPIRMPDFDSIIRFCPKPRELKFSQLGLYETFQLVRRISILTPRFKMLSILIKLFHGQSRCRHKLCRCAFSTSEKSWTPIESTERLESTHALNRRKVCTRHPLYP